MPLTADIEDRLARIGWRAQALPDDVPEAWSIARVVAQHRAGYQLHDGETMFNAQPAARFLKRDLDPTERPAVGDFVLVEAGAPPVIERILPRRTELRRGAAGESHQRQIIAANIDAVFVLNGLDGDFNPARIERYLLLIQSSGALPVVVLTKADQTSDVDGIFAELRRRVPPPLEMFAVNAKSAESVAPLLAWLGPGQSAVLVGSSGVGKSTLTNTLLGRERMATAAVREHDSRGRHTTTHRALIQLPSGGCLIDTPGMREIKLTGEEELDRSQFADIDDLASSCRFGDCGHVSEPGCAVRTALADGSLDPARWQNYLKLRDELVAAAETLEAQLRRKSETRVLTKSLGKRLTEKYGER
ncbi:MAG: ribosome small subunit-dependent GTPase A [Dokdonella sp.]